MYVVLYVSNTVVCNSVGARTQRSVIKEIALGFSIMHRQGMLVHVVVTFGHYGNTERGCMGNVGPDSQVSLKTQL